MSAHHLKGHTPTLMRDYMENQLDSWWQSGFQRWLDSRRRLLRLLRLDPWYGRVALITCAAVVLRWSAVLVIVRPCSVHVWLPEGCMDFHLWDRGYYFWQGRLIGEGHFFKNGLLYSQAGELANSAVTPPGFPLLLGSWSALGFTSVISQLLLLGLVGGATVAAVAVLARRLAGSAAGTTAAVVAALHPLLWINDATLRVESLYQLMVTLLLIGAYAYINDPRSGRAAMAGLLVGLTALVRAEALLLGPLLLLPIIWMANGGFGRRVRQVLIAGVVTSAAAAPWVVYLNIVYEEPVLLHTSSGWTLLDGSCDSVWHGDRMGFWENCFSERDLHGMFRAEFPEMELTSSGFPEGARRYGDPIHDASELDAFFRSRAFEYIGSNLSRYPLVMSVRVARMFGIYEPMDTVVKAYHNFDPPWLWWHLLGQGLYMLLLVPAAAGIWLLRRGGTSLIPLLTIWLTVAVTAAVTLAIPRYRVPVDITVIVLASVAFGYWERRRRTATAVVGDKDYSA